MRINSSLQAKLAGPAWYRGLDDNSKRAVWSSYSGFTLDAIDVQLYAFILPSLIGLWGLSGSSAGFLSAASLMSGAIGGWLAGSLSDRLGRLRILKVTIAWLAASTALCGLADSYGALLLARSFQGIGFGAEWAVGTVFLGEIVRPADRGRAFGAVLSAWASGWLVAAAATSLALWLLPPDLGWRATFFVGLIPAFWVLRSRLRLREVPGVPHPQEGRWHDIFARPMIGTTLRGTILATGMHGGYWALATWWPTMLRIERHLSLGQSTLHFAVLIGGSFIGYPLGGWIGDRLGRRITVASFALGGMTTVIAATFLPLPPGAFLMLSAAIGLFALGMYGSVGAILTELYPRQQRGAGLGFCYTVGRGLAGAGPLAVGGSLATLGIAHAIGFYVTAAYALALFAVALLPETRFHERTASEAAT